jgi:hypothetical protein
MAAILHQMPADCPADPCGGSAKKKVLHGLAGSDPENKKAVKKS